VTVKEKVKKSKNKRKIKVTVVNLNNKKGDDKQKIKLQELPIEKAFLLDYLQEALVIEWSSKKDKITKVHLDPKVKTDSIKTKVDMMIESLKQENEIASEVKMEESAMSAPKPDDEGTETHESKGQALNLVNH